MSSVELDLFTELKVGGDAEDEEELKKYKCPLVLKVCPAEAFKGGQCRTRSRIAICGATVFDPEGMDGTGMHLKPMVELGWKYCTSDSYKDCPYYRWFSTIRKYLPD